MNHHRVGSVCFVHCRTGSLEMSTRLVFLFEIVHCRTGSLEKRTPHTLLFFQVHCRTGSLETIN